MSLPYNDLTWQNFELLVTELIFKLPGFSAVRAYGAAPDNQLGIDILAKKDAATWAFQCKRVQRFGPAQFASAATAATYPANHFVLVLSCVATRSLIDAVHAVDEIWELWDAQDLDRRIQGLPDAFEFVEGYFGRTWANAFIGKRHAGTLLSVEEYFRPFTEPNKVSTFSGELVGRNDALESISRFLESSQRLYLLSGPIGIGKTRLLYEALRSPDRASVARVIREGAVLDDEVIAELPREPATIVVDDPNRVGRFENLLSYVARNNHLRLIIGTVPEQCNTIKRQAVGYGFDDTEIALPPSLRPLKRSETGVLAARALNAPSTEALEVIFQASSGIPLIIQIIAYIINSGDRSLLPSLKEEKDPIPLVLARYDDVLRGSILAGAGVSSDEARELMHLLAAVGPVDTRTSGFREKAEAKLKWPSYKIIQTLNALEHAGISIKIGSRSRIVPELLRVFILKRACLAGSVSTGYAESIVAAFGFDRQLLVNLAQIDAIGDNPGAVFDCIWAQLMNTISHGTAMQRAMTLEQLEDLAYVAPRKMMELVDFLVANPASVDPNQPLRALHEYTNEDVLQTLTPILRNTAFADFDLIPKVVRLLWQIGRNEPVRQLRNCAFDSLLNLAKYEVRKPVAINMAVLGEIERIASEESEQRYRHLPIDVVEPVLTKSFHSAQSVGASLTISKALVSIKNVATVRRKALDILSVALWSQNPRVAVRAAKLIADCLRGYEGVLDPQSASLWAAEESQVLDVLEDAAKSGPPLLKLQIATLLQWHVQLDRNATIRSRCAEITSNIEGDSEIDFLASLVPNFARHLPSIPIASTYEQLQSSIERLLSRVVQRIFDAEEPPDVLANRLFRTKQMLDEAGISASAAWLFVELANRDLSFAERVANDIIDKYPAELGGEIGAIIHRAWMEDSAWAESALSKILSSENPALYLSAANALWFTSSSPSTVADLRRRATAIEALYRLDNTGSREATLRALSTLIAADKKMGLKVALRIGADSNSKIVDDLFSGLYGFTADDFDQDDVARLLDMLVAVDELEYWVFDFLRKIESTHAEQILDVLLKRIERTSGGDSREFKPVPYGHALLPHVVTFFQQFELPIPALRTALDRGFALEGIARFWFGHLVSNLAIRAESLVRAIEEWDFASAERVGFVAEALREVPSEILFAHLDLIVALIEAASGYGVDCSNAVQSALFAAITGGVRSGVAFEPMPQDLAMIESARAARFRVIPGSASERFFLSLERHGEQSIERQRERDVDVFGEVE